MLQQQPNGVDFTMVEEGPEVDAVIVTEGEMEEREMEVTGAGGTTEPHRSNKKPKERGPSENRSWLYRDVVSTQCDDTGIFGMVVEVKQMSTKDRLERKKYMGVWRWESELTARMMSTFPNTVISIFGTVVDVKQMSTQERLERKKYMGVLRTTAPWRLRPCASDSFVLNSCGMSTHESLMWKRLDAG
ncbi:hypothetical protein QTO34_015443, partial [Cnephaeus nilssonii]